MKCWDCGADVYSMHGQAVALEPLVEFMEINVSV
jgi:hypothetical protein